MIQWITLAVNAQRAGEGGTALESLAREAEGDGRGAGDMDAPEEFVAGLSGHASEHVGRHDRAIYVIGPDELDLLRFDHRDGAAIHPDVLADK